MRRQPNAFQRGAYQQAALTADDSTRCMLAAFAYLGLPETMVDVGCGDGHLVHLANSLGVRAHGYDIVVEVEPEPYDAISQADLTRPLAHVRPWQAELTVCLEVAEHLPPSAAETLVTSLVHVTAPGGTLLFSAARPGQGGMGHLNERPASYWVGLLQHSFVLDEVLSAQLRSVWLTVAPNAWWYGLKVHIFRKRP